MDFTNPLQTVPANLPVRDSVSEEGPSKTSLLERAARLGPMRPTLESILLPTDPIVSEKWKPSVVQRRAKLTKVVKVTLGACVALCLAAVVATFVTPEASAAAPAEASPHNAPAARVSSVETASYATLGKMKGRATSRARRR